MGLDRQSYAFVPPLTFWQIFKKKLTKHGSKKECDKSFSIFFIEKYEDVPYFYILIEK
jgi:hypothetical protein